MDRLAKTATSALAVALALVSQAAGSGSRSGATAGCGQVGHAGRARVFASYTPALRTYDDNIEGSGNAPDFCADELVTNDNGAITIGIHAHNRSGFVAGDTYTVYLDTDLDAATGGGGVGAEYEILFSGPRAQLLRWNGTIFDPASPSPVPMIWAPGYGPVLLLEPAAIGAPPGFNFVLVSANGTDSDRAPDTGSWSYTRRPFALKVQSLSVGAARAGRPFTARALILRSDFDIPLDEGRIGCAARLAGHALAGKGKFANGRVVCTWRLPRNAHGKRLSGALSIAFEGVRVKRGFAARVR